MKKTPKYIYLFVVQGHYGCGWEDVCASEVRREARENLKEYRDNETQYPHRMIKRREANPEYQPQPIAV
jgi:hypothetical protein